MEKIKLPPKKSLQNSENNLFTHVNTQTNDVPATPLDLKLEIIKQLWMNLR